MVKKVDINNKKGIMYNSCLRHFI